MKVVKLLAIALVSSFVVGSSVMATSIEKSSREVKSAENTVRTQLVVALNDVNVDSNSDVYVYFNVSKAGFEVIDVNGLDADLASKVKSVLIAKSIVAPSILSGKYLIKIKFSNF
jgi:hypothetical protein